MRTQHTPGPWEIRISNAFGGGQYFDGVMGPDGERIRVEGLTLTSGPLAQANAHLIAAAPDLKEALEDFLEDYVRAAKSGDWGNWDPEEQDVVIAARAAIAKATGATT